MIPKSREEADEIRKIVYAFRANMAPEMVGGLNTRTFRVPNTFDICKSIFHLNCKKDDKKDFFIK